MSDTPAQPTPYEALSLLAVRTQAAAHDQDTLNPYNAPHRVTAEAYLPPEAYAGRGRPLPVQVRADHSPPWLLLIDYRLPQISEHVLITVVRRSLPSCAGGDVAVHWGAIGEVAPENAREFAAAATDAAALAAALDAGTVTPAGYMVALAALRDRTGWAHAPATTAAAKG